MTCIVGLKTDKGVWLGADSAAAAGYDRTIRADEKVFALEDRMLIGFTTSFRMGQLLRYKLRLPRRHADDDLMHYMVVDVIDAIRTCLKQGGFASIENGEESGGDFLVATEGRLFHVCSDFQVAEASLPYDATGCGRMLALGAFHATEPVVAGEVQGDDGVVVKAWVRRPDYPPETRIRMALEAAAAHSAGVAPPFVIRHLPNAGDQP